MSVGNTQCPSSEKTNLKLGCWLPRVTGPLFLYRCPDCGSWYFPYMSRYSCYWTLKPATQIMTYNAQGAMLSGDDREWINRVSRILRKI